MIGRRNLAWIAVLVASLAAAPAALGGPLDPLVVTGPPVDGGPTATTLTGAVMPKGLDTSYHFEWGTTTAYGNSTPAQDAGSGPITLAVTAPLAGLTPGSVIHYRLVASNPSGTGTGLDQLAILPPAPLPPGPLPPGSPPSPPVPSLTGLNFTQQPTVGKPTTFTVSGSDPSRPLTGVKVDFADAGHTFAESACRLRPGANTGVFAPRRANTFKIPYAFETAGVHRVTLTLISGACTGRQRATTQTIDVAPQPAAPAARVVHSAEVATVHVAGVADVHAAGGCRGSGALPNARNTKLIAQATICLLNQQRRAAHLGPLRPESKLLKAAELHAHYMLSEHFFAHQGPGEPPLGTRFRLERYHGGGGENLGIGSGRPYETPASMVRAWMASPPHRANILFAGFHTIAQFVAPERPEPPVVPGATYVTEFGTTRR